MNIIKIDNAVTGNYKVLFHVQIKAISLYYFFRFDFRSSILFIITSPYEMKYEKIEALTNICDISILSSAVYEIAHNLCE